MTGFANQQNVLIGEGLTEALLKKRREDKALQSTGALTATRGCRPAPPTLLQAACRPSRLATRSIKMNNY